MTRETKERLMLDLLPQVRMEASKAARRFGGNRDDLIQDASLATWIALDHFDASLGFQLWTFISSVVRYRLMNTWRTTKRHKRTPAIGLCEEESDYRTSEYNPDSEFADLIKCCRPRDAEILKAMFVDGLTQSEIGQQQGCEHQAISTCARRAMATIRERLGVIEEAKERRTDLRRMRVQGR
jgi:RNA polymerase sigma factor (sigma-70 family)